MYLLVFLVRILRFALQEAKLHILGRIPLEQYFTIRENAHNVKVGSDGNWFCLTKHRCYLLNI